MRALLVASAGTVTHSLHLSKSSLDERVVFGQLGLHRKLAALHETKQKDESSKERAGELHC